MAWLAASVGDGAGARNLPGLTGDAGCLTEEAPVVLFVEDHPMLRYTVAEQLNDAGYTVILASCGEDALALLANGAEIDVLLTDLRLPGTIDGWDVAEAAREFRPDLPVIYASAYSYVTPRQVPGSIMLDKPYPPEELIEALESLLD